MSPEPTPFPASAQRLLPSPPPPRFGIRTHDDLQSWLNSKPRKMPPRRSLRELSQLSREHQESYRRERLDYLRNFPTIAHPQMKGAFDTVRERLVFNATLAQPDAPGIRLTGRTHTGKSTLLRAVVFDHHMRAKLGGTHAPDAAHVSTILLQGSASTTAKALLRQLLGFFGPAYAKDSPLQNMEDRLYTLLRECGTTLIVLDEAHRFSATDSHGRQTIDAIRSLQSAVPGLTIILAGVDLDRKALFTANRRFTAIEAEQMRARFQRVGLTAYTDDGIDYDADTSSRTARKDSDQDAYLDGLSQALIHLPLLTDSQQDGFGLANNNLAGRLYAATEGKFGITMRRIIEATIRAIHDGTEQLSDQNLDLTPAD